MHSFHKVVKKDCMAHAVIFIKIQKFRRNKIVWFRSAPNGICTKHMSCGITYWVTLKEYRIIKDNLNNCQTKHETKKKQKKHSHLVLEPKISTLPGKCSSTELIDPLDLGHFNYISIQIIPYEYNLRFICLSYLSGRILERSWVQVPFCLILSTKIIK